MLTDGLFTIGEARLKFDKYNEPFNLYVISDIHRNSPACDVKKWHEFLDEANDGKSYYLFLGDLFDSLSTSERKTLRSGDFHESTTSRWEKIYKQDVKDFCDECSFMKGRVVGVLGGNHFFAFSSGITSDQMVAEELGAKYLGCNTLIRLYLERDKHHSHVIDVCAHHGLGGNSSGASVNRLEQMAKSFSADLVLMGHNHNRAVDYINRLGLTDVRNGQLSLENRRIMLARTGSFLRSFEPGKASYAVDAGYSPSDLGALKVVFTPRREQLGKRGSREDRRWVDIKAEV